MGSFQAPGLQQGRPLGEGASTWLPISLLPTEILALAVSPGRLAFFAIYSNYHLPAWGVGLVNVKSL